MSPTRNVRQTRRKQILHELGLVPVWRTRSATQAPQPHASPVPRGVHPVQPESRDARSLRVDATEGRRSQILRMDWDQLKASVEGCVACPLCKSRTRTVFGVGDQSAEWLYVGEGPGAQEDARGEPFVGPAGQLLDSMLAAIDLTRRRNVYIANIVKCRPPGNREPIPEEAQRCEPYLAQQIELIRPKLIIALGKVAADNLLHKGGSLASLRGRLHEYKGIAVIVTYHPAYLLRNLPAKAKAWEDLCFARSTMQRLLLSGN